MPSARRTDRFTRQKAERRAAMGLIFAGAGILWSLCALLYTGRLDVRSLTYSGTAGAAALVACVVVLRRARRSGPAHIPTAESMRIRRIVVAVNILEWVAVATAVSVLMLLHLPEYILTASGIIVGLYLYPIAGALRAPMHTVTATLLVSWNVIVLALLPRTRQMSPGAGITAVILLASAAGTLGWALWRTRSVVAVSRSLPANEPADSLTR